jgi:dihydrofolate reductase
VLTDPTASKHDREFAQAFAAKQKVVFSRTLTELPDSSARIARGELREEILKLKQRPGKEMIVGGVDLPTQLIQLGLVDEFRFVIGPVMVGAGRRLLDEVSLPERQRLRLIDSKVSKSGFVALHYAKQ